MAQSAASELPWCDLCGGGDSSGPERVYAKSSQAPADIDDAPVVMADNTRADSGERVELEPMSADVGSQAGSPQGKDVGDHPGFHDAVGGSDFEEKDDAAGASGFLGCVGLQAPAAAPPPPLGGEFDAAGQEPDAPKKKAQAYGKWDCCFVLAVPDADEPPPGDAEAAPPLAPAASEPEVVTNAVKRLSQGLTQLAGEELKGLLKKPRTELTLEALLKKLTQSGLQHYAYKSVQGDEIYVKVRASLQRLQQHAESMGASYQLDEVKIERKVTAGFPALGIKPIHIGNECRGKKMCRWRPYEHIHAKYDTHPDLVDLYAVPPSEEKTKWPFNSMMRTKLIWDILHSRVEDGGCGLDINSLTFHDDILAFLTLHDAAERNALYAAFIQQPWSSFVHPPYTHLPLAQYKNYFGEMHGMRMAFTAHITSAYYILAAVGFAILVETLVAGTEATKAVISYTFFLVIWSIVVSEKWKTRQCALSVTWGTRGFEENEKPRPQYTGYMVASPITGKPEVFFPPRERQPSMLANVAVVLFMILLNLAFLGVVFYLKAARPGFLGSVDFQLFSYFVSFVNAFGIQFFYFLFKAVAVKLNDRENWRTETQYHDYLTSKMFYFYIVNYYAPLYYLTFIQYYANPFTTNQKARGDDNGYDTVAEQVFGELRTTVIVILGVALVSQNASRVLMPLLKEYWQKSSEGGIDTEMSVPELQYVLFEYDEVLDTTYDYMLITMQYGYVILFSAAFPGAPVCALIINSIQMRTDTYAFLTLYRRIMPNAVEDIGVFQDFFGYLNVAGVITNVAIAIYVTSSFNNGHGYTHHERDTIFIALVMAFFSVMGAIKIFLDEVPLDVHLQMGRQQFINEKIIEKIADVDSAEALDEAAEIDYVVNDKDDGPYYRDISFYRDDDHISSFMQSMELLEKEGEKLENFEKLEVEKLETTFSKNKPKTDTV